MKNIRTLSFFILVIACGCEPDNQPPLPVKGDYLPVNQATRHYLREQFSDPDLSQRFYYDTISIAFVGDTVIANKTYHRFDHFSLWDSGNGIIEVHDYYRFFRKEGSQYLEPALYPDGQEFVFLDVERPAGSSWSYYSGVDKEVKTTYTIKAVNSLRQINGVPHEHVIEVEMEVRTRNNKNEEYGDVVGKSSRFFAKDRGEIFSLSAWYTYSGALRLSEVGN